MNALDPSPADRSRPGRGRGWAPFLLAVHAACQGAPAPVDAQEPSRTDAQVERIWGRVLTRDGESREGRLRFARSDATVWADFFRAKRIAREDHYRQWIDAARGGDPAVRFVEVEGYRVSWEERHPAFPERAETAVRVGRLAALAVRDDGSFDVILRGGDGEDPPPSWRARADPGALTVEVAGGADGAIRVKGSDVLRIDFAAPPRPVPQAARPLYGTVTDRTGRTFAGFVAWGDWTLDSDTAHGDYWGDRRNLPFRGIRSLEKSSARGGARVELVRGFEDADQVADVLFRSRDVHVSDPEFGRVVGEWSDVWSLRLTEAPGRWGYDAFAAARRLVGAVTTRTGEEIRGRIRWNADQEWSWGVVRGRSDDVPLAIELDGIASVERLRGAAGAGPARVELADGRAYELRGGNDAGIADRGILVLPVDPEPGERARARHVAWTDVRIVRFERRAGDGR